MTKNIIHVFQPALPTYRLDFFGRLSDYYGESFKVHYSQSNLGKLTQRDHELTWSNNLGSMKKLTSGVYWQRNSLRVKFNRGDVVVVCGNPKDFSTLAILMKAKAVGAKTVWWGQYWGANSTQLRQDIRMAFAKLADNILFYTDEEVSSFHRDRRKSRGIVRALNNGINSDDVILYRKTYRFEQRNMNVLFIGRITDKSNFHLLTQALSLPGSEGIKLHVIGASSPQGVVNHGCITYHGEITDEEQISAIANMCSIFVYPGQVGLSLIHAMAYGLPCLVHCDRKRHMPEISAFREGITGSTFKQGDAKSLLESMLRLLSSPQQLQNMSKNCVSSVADNYSTKYMSCRFIEMMKEIGFDNGQFQ